MKGGGGAHISLLHKINIVGSPKGPNLEKLIDLVRRDGMGTSIGRWRIVVSLGSIYFLEGGGPEESRVGSLKFYITKKGVTLFFTV